MHSAIWTYVWDVADEGIPAVLDHIHTRGGIQGVNLAVSYHSGMFFLPHNPKRKVYYPQPSIYFTPDRARYANLKIQPIVNDLAEAQIVEQMRTETARRGMGLHAWTVCLHNTGLGMQYPDCTQTTVFGDQLFPQLCPSNPHVRAYMAALIGDIGCRGFDSVLLESLEFMPFHHYGYHHEVVGVPFTPVMSWLMGLCFCDSCRAGARQAGVDIDGVATFVRAEAEKFFAGDLAAGRAGMAWGEIKALAGGEIGAFHAYRRDTVTSLFQQIAAELPAGARPRLEACDFGPLWSLGADGSTWESGFDPQAVAPYVDALHPCPYFVPADQVQKKMDEYRAIAPSHLPLIPAMRAIPPQIVSAEDLSAKIAACRPESVAGFTFYNYGFMRLTTLDWIKAALLPLG